MTPTEKYLRLRIPRDLWNQLEALAKEDRRSITQLAIILLQKQLAQELGEKK